MRWAETDWPNRAEGLLGLLTHGLRPDWWRGWAAAPWWAAGEAR